MFSKCVFQNKYAKSNKKKKKKNKQSKKWNQIKQDQPMTIFN